MKLFIDTGSVAEVEEIAAWGVLSGATTNPSLLAKEEGDPGDAIRRICELVDGPTSAEVVSDNARDMVAEGRALAGLDDRIVVKVPFSAEGLAATRELAADGIPVNGHLGGRGRGDRRGAWRESRGAGARGLDAQPGPRGHRRTARLRGLDRSVQGAEADARPPAHRGRDREVRR